MSAVATALAAAAVGYAVLIVVSLPAVLAVLVVEGFAYRRRRAGSAARTLVARAAPAGLVHEGGRTWQELVAAADRAGVP